ncbi:MAG: GPR endopeptidase [Clostridia bacterium]|nr:GPR endopeptidase [Clostridia bacterium]
MDRVNKRQNIQTPATGVSYDSVDKTMLCRNLADVKCGIADVSRVCEVRTDMALESIGDIGEDKQGVYVNEDKRGEKVRLTKVEISTPERAETLGKPMGTYFTIDMEGKDPEYDPEVYDTCIQTCVQCIKELCGNISSDAPIMVLGLGNRYVTADSLGTKVTEQVLVTRHMWGNVPEKYTAGIRSLCAMAPGVLGITGIETAETVKGIVEVVKPGLVIVIDALASRSIGRLGKSIQLTDSGIVPGSGVGNRRMELSKETLGIPVVAIGVPTVVDAATLTVDTVDLLLESLADHVEPKSKGQILGLLEHLDGGQKHLLFKEVLYPRIGDMVVTPKDVDALIEKMSSVLSAAINMAFHGVDTRKQEQEYLWTNIE